MNSFVDNVVIHRLGRVIQSKRGEPIRRIDALSLFHIAEHIMFSDQIVVWLYPTDRTSYERTAQLLEILDKYFGVLSDEDRIIKADNIVMKDYVKACRMAAKQLSGRIRGTPKNDIYKLADLID